MVHIFGHVDTWKCHAHNKVIENRRSCDLCVTSARNQLHAQGICESESVQARAPITVHAKPPLNIPCTPWVKEVWGVNIKSHHVAGYLKLYSTVQGMFLSLDATTCERVWNLRRQYESQVAYREAYEHRRIVGNCARDMWFEARNLTGVRQSEVFMDEFEAHFIRCWDAGQHVVKIPELPVGTIKVPKGKYSLNISSRSSYGYNQTNASTKACLTVLDKCEGALGPIRLLEEAKIKACGNNHEARVQATEAMAEKLWNALPGRMTYAEKPKIKAQFISVVIWSYTHGNQRISFIED